MKKTIYFLFAVIILVGFTGCAAKEQNQLEATAPVQQTTQTPPVTEAVDQAAKKLLEDYFSILFSVNSVDIYTEKTRMGIIPDSIKQYISDKTIQEGNGNPEIGIHLPRFISINGMTIIGYDIVRLGENAAPDIKSGFVGKNGENLIYFCKITTKVRAVSDDVFEQCFDQQTDNTYKRKKEIPGTDIDGMRIEIRYDVELDNTSGELKILRAIESNIKPGLKNRLFILNNESITRLPYLDLSLTADGSAYNSPADGEIYEKEKALIANLFENLVTLDRERMNLLSYKWKQGLNDVKNYWDTLGITKNKEGTADIIQMDDKFAANYPYESLPLRFNMEKLKGITNVVVTPHPAYSDFIKWYFVNFDVPVQRTNGITDEDFLYRYDYLVILSNKNGTLFIEKFKLNEYYTVQQ